MTTKTLDFHADPAQDPGVVAALRELVGAAGKLSAALFASFKTPVSSAPRTAYDDAEAVRAMADRFAATDPSYAEDLYAAADRHERSLIEAEA